MRSTILLVDDSPGHLRAARGVLLPYARVRVARCAKSALDRLTSERFHGVAVSATLAQGQVGVIDVIAEARRRIGAFAPIVVVGHATKELEDRASLLGAAFCGKPLTVRSVLDLLAPTRRQAVEGASVVGQILSVLDEVRTRASLTPTQTDVLVAYVFGETRDDLRERLRCTDATLRKHVSATLQKVSELGLEASSLDRLVCALYVRATVEALSEGLADT